MLNCPHCHQPMQQDPKNADKVLCYNCRKRYDAAKVEEWQAAVAHEQSMSAGARFNHQPPAQSPSESQPYDPAYIYGTQPGTKPPKGLAIASLILAIVALLNSWIPLVNVVSVLFGIISIILGIAALRRVKKGTGAGRGLGRAGISISVISILASVAISGFLIMEIQNIIDNDTHTYTSYEEYMGEITSELSSNIGANIGYNDMSPWTKLEFSVNGKTYKLMDSTLRELEESGYILDLEGQGYPDGYTVEPGQMISVIELQGENDYEEYFIVNVANLTEEPMDIKDCVLTKFDYDNAGEGNAVSVSDVTCGATFEQVESVFGEPQDTREDGAYMLYQYETRMYTKYFQVVFAEGAVKGFTLSSMEY